jgi:hypothetical protein
LKKKLNFIKYFVFLTVDEPKKKNNDFNDLAVMNAFGKWSLADALSGTHKYICYKEKI